ncbi:MAG: 3-hydroxyacyl-CoA dehydrogenase family protein [Myxococcales bacterium]|nr:3-hydroxyacyl-CoA dehydrogenase family protein [Myxococcales bacterium]
MADQGQSTERAQEEATSASPRGLDRRIEHVVILGANGTMGYGSGALFTRAAPRVSFLARSKEKAEAGLASAIAQVRSATVARRVETGSYDDLEARLADADLIFEAVAERLEVKRPLFERVDACRRSDAIVATVTSGLSIDALAEGRSESFRRHFAGLHFFNPPNVIVGTELVAGRATDPAILEFLERYAARELGREMVRVADRPGFAGNRIGFKVLNEVAQLSEEHGPLLMDRLIGPYTGRALPPLRTIDLVGWDVHRAIVENVYANAPDEAHASLALPAYMRTLIEAGVLGRKSGRGFFAKEGERRLVLDPKRMEHRPIEEIELPELRFIDEIAALHRVGRYREAMRCFAEAEGEHASLARKVIAGYLSYALHRVGEVCEQLGGIDRIMAFGFNWAAPGLLLDTLGARTCAAMMREAELPIPPLLEQALSSGRIETFMDPSITNQGRYFVAG